MRVISMVPSWTETLLACGFDVVGRTRYCIHPDPKIKAIPIVGGTKNVDWKKVSSCQADLLLLDKEENPESMAKESPLAYFATHVSGIGGIHSEIEAMADRLAKAGEPAVRLRDLARRWAEIEKAAPLRLKSWEELPGVEDWIRKPDSVPARVAYVIWREPWMAAAPGTFIASVLAKLGLPTASVFPFVEGATPQARYPSFELKDVPEDTVFLFSSEPFPFRKKRAELAALSRPAAIVDGECFSWFGLRSLEFLEKVFGAPSRSGG